MASISFHLGTSVFDGMMAYWNRDHYYIHRVEEHLVRFCSGAARMGLHFSWSIAELSAGITDLLKLEPPGTQYIRPIVFRGAPELWVTGSEGRPVDVSIFTVRTESHRDIDASISCELSEIERISSRSIPGQIKVSGAYVNSFFARKTAEKSGFDDGLMFDREGHLTEASAANVFLISGEQPLLVKRVNYFESARFRGLFDPHLNHEPPPRLVDHYRCHAAQQAAEALLALPEKNVRFNSAAGFAALNR